MIPANPTIGLILAFLVSTIFSERVVADTPEKQLDRRSKETMAELTPGKSYTLTTVIVEGDERITTSYWASVDSVDETTVTLKNIFWSERVDTGDRLIKEGGLADRLIRAINRLYPGKPLVGFGAPLNDEKLVLNRNQIATTKLLPEEHFQEMAEGSRSFHDRRPRSLELNAKRQ